MRDVEYQFHRLVLYHRLLRVDLGWGCATCMVSYSKDLVSFLVVHPAGEHQIFVSCLAMLN